MIIPEEQIWMVVVGFIVAFVLAFGIGANDVANSFGTSVGSKVLTLKQACTLATICELAGAILLGAKVSNTIRTGIIDIDRFVELQNGPAVLMAGQVAALGGSCIWLLVATFFRLPVSGTHSIVGATIGFSVIVFGFESVRWIGVLKIVSSWFVSPLLSGLCSVGMFYILRCMILTKEEPLEPALRLLPAFYGVVVLVNVFSILYDGPQMLRFDEIPLYGVFLLSCGLGALTAIVVKLFWVPYFRRRVMGSEGTSSSWTNKLKYCRPPKVRIVSHSFSAEPRSESIQTEKMITSTDEVTHRSSTDVGPVDSKMESNESKEASSNAFVPRQNEADVDCARRALPERRKPMYCCLPCSTASHTSPTGEIELSPRDENCSHGSILVSAVEFPATVKIENKSGSTSTTMDADLSKETTSSKTNEESGKRKYVKDRPVEARVFALLQIVTAVFGSFAHGGNDVSNAIGPLIGLWIVGTTQMVNSELPTPIWVLCYGGLGISVGLWIWGRRVIQTLGNDLTNITPSTGVCIEVGSALTVLIASKIGLPISTTHCKVGSVVGVGRARSKDGVNWGIFRNILIAWLVTLPVAGAFSALLMYCFTFAV